MKRLENKIAFVTGGGGSGIGSGISLELAREGAHVVIAEIDLGAAEGVVRRIQREGGAASVIEAEISRSHDVERAIDQVIRSHGRLDVLVNNAGIGLIRAPAEATEEEFDHLMAVDLRGLWLCCKHAIPHMQRQRSGAIVNITSVHARATMSHYGIYAGMKAGVAGLTRGLAVEYGPEGIRANAIAPGFVDSAQNRVLIARFAPDVDAWVQSFVTRCQALPVVIQPPDVGKTVAFLASDDARSITGAEIPVDAGLWAMLTSRDH
jgi:NAD(P)-dependent dehydrogenase (short-subunit alcohol dehydrogenase family)